jgi:hypothetical protein
MKSNKISFMKHCEKLSFSQLAFKYGNYDHSFRTRFFFIQNGHAFAKVDEKPILVGYWGRKGAYDWGFPGL